MNKFPKLPAKSRDVAKAAAKPIENEPVQNTHAVRETVESIVIAFILAFLFRTFEAEAFVIPTGSMAPTLMGRHKDVDCAQCRHRFRVTDSDDEEVFREEIAALIAKQNQEPHLRSTIQAQIDDYRQRIRNMQVVGGVCPVCRFPMPFSADSIPEVSSIKPQPTYNGDRILVNKYLYTLTDPKRWDVVVFHFPGDAEINYIKRLVGLPGETLRVFQGDLLVGPPEAKDDEFKISRKPPDKFLAVRQLVHDTNYDAAALYESGWPLRWKAESPTGDDGWKTDAKIEGDDVQQTFNVDRTAGGDAWLRYHHKVPNKESWQRLAARKQSGPDAKFSADDLAESPVELVMDFNAYNTRILRKDLQFGLWPEATKLGNHWVGDLMVEADVTVTEAKGELLLDLVKAGKHFKCSIDLSTGQATLGIDGVNDFAPTAKTPVSAPGQYRVAFANVDDQLLLWASKKTLGSSALDLEPKLISFDQETTYDATKVFGAREPGMALRPQTSTSDRGDLAPAGIGARGSKLTVTRLQLWRDIYYIADSNKRDHGSGEPISDYSRLTDMMLTRLRSDPQMWDEFTRRRHVDFPLAEDQFFVMGDNSPESSDARLWSESRNNGQPSGAYLERKQLIGKAIFVYWPHSWFRLPFVKLGIVPNIKDMRLVK